MPRSAVGAHAVAAAKVEWHQWLAAAKKVCSIPASERKALASDAAAQAQAQAVTATATAPRSADADASNAAPRSASSAPRQLRPLAADERIASMQSVLDIVVPFSIQDVRALLVWGGSDVLTQYMTTSAGCKDVAIASWAPLEMDALGAPTSLSPVSTSATAETEASSSASGGGWRVSDEYTTSEAPANLFRKLTLTKPVSVPMAGTFEAKVKTDESCNLIGGPNGRVVFRGQMQTTGVPMADRFTIESRTVYTRHPPNSRVPTEACRMQ
jgi:hypothetical protein